MSLNAKQQLFIKEYLIDKNATQAYIRAGYSKKGADVSASRLLANASIKEVIDKELQDRMDKLDFDGLRVLNSIKELAEICLQKKPMKRWNIKTGKEEEYYKALDSAGANTALANLGKYFKLFTEKVEHTGADGKDLFNQDPTKRTFDEVMNALAQLQKKK